MTAEEHDDLYYKVPKAFNPATPIDSRALFSGRKEQVRKVIDVIIHKGQHAIIFGERGVGKPLYIAHTRIIYLQRYLSLAL